MNIVFSLAVLFTSISGVYRHDKPKGMFIQLAGESQFQPVCAVYNGPKHIGSCTFIKADWVITAKHVVTQNNVCKDSIYIIFEQSPYYVDKIIFHADADLALLHTQTMTAVNPASCYADTNELNHVCTLVGFGYNNKGNTPLPAFLPTFKSGEKLAGQNIIDKVTEKHLKIDFDNPDDPDFNVWGDPDPLEYEYLPMSGDSGGGLFVQIEDTWFLAGVITGFYFSTELCKHKGDLLHECYGSIGISARISAHLTWINQVINGENR